MNTDDQHDFLHPRRGPAPLTPSDLAEQLAADHPQLSIQPDAPLLGGMGAVYRATLTTSAGPRPVAIKVLHWHLMDDPAFTARFQREQALLSTLNHENIVKLHDTGHTAEGLPFLVMDWIEGRSLTEFTQPGSTTDRQFLLRIAADLCAATHYAHEIEYKDAQGVPHKGILHRDLKPQNIIVTAAGRAVVLDFGIARPLTPGHTLTQPGDAPGTHGYIAPEVLAGEKPDARADIYSLGIIIYQLLMKKLPDVFAARPSEHSLDPRFDDIVMKAAASEPEKRYKTAGELKRALELIPIMNVNSANAPVSSSAEKAAPNVTDGQRENQRVLIEIEDYRIKINGLDFTFFATLDQVIEALGAYSRTSNLYMTQFRDAPYGAIYYWDNIGISVFVRMFFNEIPHVISFNVWFSPMLCASEQTQDSLLSILEGVPFVKGTSRSAFTGKLRFGGDELNSASSEALIQKHRHNNFFYIHSAADSPPDIDVVFSPDNQPGRDASEKLRRQLSLDPLKGNVIKISALVLQGSRKTAAIAFWPITSEKRNGAMGSYDLERIDIGHDLGSFNSIRTLETFSESYVISQLDGTKRKWIDSFEADESMLLAGPGPAYHFETERLAPHPKWEAKEWTRRSDDGWIVLTNKRILAKNSEGEWSSFLLSDFPQIIRIEKEYSGLDAILNIFERREPLHAGKIAQLLMGKWIAELSQGKGNRYDAKQSWRIRFAVLAKKKHAVFAMPFISPEFPSENFEIFKQELNFLFHCAGILAFDNQRKFPKSWLKKQHGNSAGHGLDQPRLYPCRTCGKEVAKSARACPHCGENLRGMQKPSGWRQKACTNCGEAMVRFAQKCQQPDCGHPNTWLKVQSFAATLAVLGTGLWSFLHFQQHLMVGLALPLMATTAALGWRGTLFLLKSFYGH